MRHTPLGSRPVRIRFAGGLTLALLLALSTNPARAQAVKKAPAGPPPFDTRPLARFVPKDGVVLYLESSGIDSQAEAWKKTAASKMLNETTLGEMLEDVFSQLAENFLSRLPKHKLSGADLLTITKHAAKQGFVVSLSSGSSPDGPLHAVVVFKGGAGREVRPAFSRLVGEFMGESKPQLVKKAGRSIVSVPATGGRSWIWWSEQNDLVIASHQDDLESIAAAIDGQKPTAVEHPLRAELSRTESGFTPIALLFLDPEGVPKGNSDASKALGEITKTLGGALDYRWGLQDDALMSVTRIHSQKPRSPQMALFDQPTFDKSKLPPLPDGIETFTVVSLDGPKTLDALLGTGLPGGGGKLKETLDTLKTKSKIDLRKDLLTHIGPKAAFYVMTGEAAARAPGDPAGANSLAGLLGGGAITPAVLTGMGLIGADGQIPRFTLIADIDDADAFGKALDNVMVAVNKSLKEQAAAEVPANARGAAGGLRPGGPPGGGYGDAPGGGNDPNNPRRREPPPVVEFKLMIGKDKAYVLYVPPSLASQYPAGFRPSIRVGAKHVAFATTPDAARKALELKPGAWTPPGDLAAGFDQLSRDLIFLNVDDPRSTQPEILASLPGNLQRGVNTFIAMAQGKAPGAEGGPGAPGGPGAGGPPPGGGRDLGGRRLEGGPGEAPGGSGSSGYGSGGGGPPGGSAGGGGQPGGGSGGGGQPGGDPAGAAAPGMLQLNIDAAKLPKVDDLRTRFFPATLAISVDDSMVTITQRVAFPNVVSPASAVGVAVVMPAVQAARAAAAKAAGVAPGGIVPGGLAPPGLAPPPGQPAGGPGAATPPGAGARGGGRAVRD